MKHKTFYICITLSLKNKIQVNSSNNGVGDLETPIFIYYYAKIPKTSILSRFISFQEGFCSFVLGPGK